MSLAAVIRIFRDQMVTSIRVKYFIQGVNLDLARNRETRKSPSDSPINVNGAEVYYLNVLKTCHYNR